MNTLENDLIAYKKYKNKLTNIMRTCKKEYYTKILENNKDKIKGIWNILNSGIRDTPRYINCPQYFICIVFVMYLGH